MQPIGYCAVSFVAVRVPGRVGPYHFMMAVATLPRVHLFVSLIQSGQHAHQHPHAALGLRRTQHLAVTGMLMGALVPVNSS